jgi:hypothetical protein
MYTLLLKILQKNVVAGMNITRGVFDAMFIKHYSIHECAKRCEKTVLFDNVAILSTSGVLNLLQTWGHIPPLLPTPKPQRYKRGYLTESPLKFIKNATKLGLLLQKN